MDHFQRIYAHDAERYDRLVAREDARGNLLATLQELCAWDGALAVDLGAGTGRMTRLAALLARQVVALDAALPMLRVGQAALAMSGLVNWGVAAAANQALPLPNACADVVIEGWSFGHAVGWYPDAWQAHISAMLQEAQRLLKPGGTLILLETLGTGQRTPLPPTAGLAALYAWWEQAWGMQHRWIRTDYHFATVAEADELVRFFFGAELADQVLASGNLVLPECTGVWWQSY